MLTTSKSDHTRTVLGTPHHRRLIALALAVSLGGCASLPPPGNKLASTAIANSDQTTLGRIAAHALGTSTFSGFSLESSGKQALEDRLALIDRAERSLDLQYFIIGNDQTVLILLRHVRAAANRGVRVRLLVDDINTVGRDSILRRLANHRNIEVRLFNPFAGERSSIISRFATSGTDLQQLSHRMHNKLFIADNALAITGGRNLSDPYFLYSAANNFIDLDVIAAGPIVHQLSAMFDRYWNDDHAYPVQAIVNATEDDDSPPAEVLAAAHPSSDTFSQQLKQDALVLEVAPATLLADAPAKINSEHPEAEKTVATNVASLMDQTQHELVIITPYLIPTPKTMALFKDLAARGVHIRILTNSLASTDTPLAHIGYAQYRVALLQLGVELYELKPLIGQSHHLRAFGSSHAALHAKALVVDGEKLFVGSMNLDPRSAFENTEMGLVIDSMVLAQRMKQIFSQVTREASYRVKLQADGSLQWTSKDAGGQTQSWDSDPEAGFLLKLKLWLIGPIVPKNQL